MTPTGIDELAAVTVMLASVAGVTVRVVLPLIAPEVALIVAVPVPVPAARPWLPARLLMVATAAEEELHCTVVVMSCVL